MSNEFNHKGYSGSCVASIEDCCLHGRILFIDDLITYEGETVSELEASFEDAVDRYIKYCNQTGKPANKPYSGSFNVRVGPELHRAAAQRAKHSNISLNEYVRCTLEKDINKSSPSEVVRHELTVNHNHVITDRDSVAVPFSIKEPAWNQNQEKLSLSQTH